MQDSIQISLDSLASVDMNKRIPLDFLIGQGGYLENSIAASATGLII